LSIYIYIYIYIYISGWRYTPRYAGPFSKFATLKFKVRQSFTISCYHHQPPTQPTRTTPRTASPAAERQTKDRTPRQHPTDDPTTPATDDTRHTGQPEPDGTRRDRTGQQQTGTQTEAHTQRQPNRPKHTPPRRPQATTNHHQRYSQRINELKLKPIYIYVYILHI
jgi:hypothetical protein